jgi:hypothetical protein
LEEPEAATLDMAAAVATGGGVARVWWRRLGLGGGSGSRNQV